MKQFNMGNSFEQNMPSTIKNEPFLDIGRPTNGDDDEDRVIVGHV